MRMSKEETQQKILAYIRNQIEERGFPPSVREIGKAVGFKSTASVHAHLSEMEQTGLISRDAAKPRAIEISDAPRGRSVPLVGKVTAGTPILAQENIEEELVLPDGFVGDGRLFALRVEGTSMIEAGILDGDVVIVRSQPDAENGDIVVAMIEGEATVKRIFYESERVRLQPENALMEPIYARDAIVLGRVVALLRAF